MINIGLSFNYSKFYRKNQDGVENFRILWYNMAYKQTKGVPKMAEKNNKETSALVYPNWSVAGKQKESSARTSNLKVLPNGSAETRNHHIADDDEALPMISETKEEKKLHQAEVRAVRKEQDQQGFQTFAEDVDAGSYGKGWMIFFALVFTLAMICFILSLAGVV